MHSLSRWIADVTQPQHPFYHPVQALLIGGCSYLGTACLSSTPPKNAMTLTITAYTISHLTAPLFSEWLEPYKEFSLVPLVGQVVHLTICFSTANIICKIGGRSVSFKAVGTQIIFFLSTVSVLKLGLLRFRHSLQSDQVELIQET